MNKGPITDTSRYSISSSLRSSLAELSSFFASRNVEAYLVGGAVRDSQLGLDTPDVDLAVDADTTVIGRSLADNLAGRFVLMDAARGIVRLVLSDGGRIVDLKPMRAGIMADLAQRDFTCDAMAVPLVDAAAGHMDESLIDPYNGLSDLRSGVIRAIGPSIFAEDPGRLMRVPRLAAKLGFTIERETAQRIRNEAGLVQRVAPERVRDELLKLLAEPRTTESLRLLDDLGLLSKVIPELDDARDVVQPKEHYWDVFNHLIETPGQVERIVGAVIETPGEMESSGPVAGGPAVSDAPGFDGVEAHFEEELSDGHTRLTFLKLTALLHDVSKPETKTVESTGRIRFLGHHTRGAEVAGAIASRLRIGGRGVELVRLMVQNHLRPGQMANGDELPTRRAIYRYFRDVGDAAIDTLYLNMADHFAARGPMMSEREWSERCRTIRHILHEGFEQKAPYSLPNLLDGHDIMECFSLSPGPRVGQLLGLVEEAQACGEVTTKEEALRMVSAQLKAEAERVSA